MTVHASNRFDRRHAHGWLAGGIVLLISILAVWAYWPTVVELVTIWRQQPDYAHGFFVAPAAVFLLYCRKESFPPGSVAIGWAGLLLILASVTLRLIGWRYYLSFADGLSIVVWIAGAVWLLAGWSVFKWSWPAIAFLVFMVPLPFRLEMLLSVPLQGIATSLSAFILQLFGEPAVVEGNTIFLSGNSLEVANACSGLRIFMTSLALGSAFAIAFQRNWLESVVIILSALPIAVIANTFRIVLTGLLAHHASHLLSKNLIHNLPGWIMIPVTAALFAGLIWYLNRLMPAIECYRRKVV